MKIGIVVYSQTGNTLSIAEKLKDFLASAGHTARIERLAGEVAPNNPKDVRLGPLPDLSGYEALVLAAPVQGFQLHPVMAAYLPQLPSLEGKKAACFTTKHFNNAWSGATRALAAMSAGAQEKGGKVCASGYVSVKSKTREKDTEALVEKLGKSFD